MSEPCIYHASSRGGLLCRLCLLPRAVFSLHLFLPVHKLHWQEGWGVKGTQPTRPSAKICYRKVERGGESRRRQGSLSRFSSCIHVNTAASFWIPERCKSMTVLSLFTCPYWHFSSVVLHPLGEQTFNPSVQSYMELAAPFRVLPRSGSSLC